MKNDDIQDLIERLQGFDDETLRSEMTDGLDEWCVRRRRRGRVVKRVALLLLLLLTTTAIALTAMPQWRKVVLGGEEPREIPAVVPAAPQHEETPVEQESPKTQPATAIDYYYSGRSEEGYSVSYGHDTRTLIYTRRVGNRIVSSFVHNAPDSLFVDTLTDTLAPPSAVALLMDTVTQEKIVYDFLAVSPQGDTLLFAIVDSARHCVSVYSDEERYGRCRDTLVLPAWVSHDGLRYTVATVGNKAFAGASIRALVLPTSLQSVSDSAFSDCWRLRNVVVLGEVPPQLGADVFASINRKAQLTVPCRTVDAYEAAPHWGSSFQYNIEEACPDTEEEASSTKD